MNEEERYRDQIRFFSRSDVDGQAVQRRLAHTNLVGFGAGWVGSYAFTALAEAGIGAIKIIDGAEINEADFPFELPLQSAEAGNTRAGALALQINRRVGPHSPCQNLTLDSLDDDDLVELIQGADAMLVCLDSPAPSLVDAVNRAALRTKTPWIIGQVYGRTAWIGPTVKPQASPCYKCYELRRNANLENYDELMQYESRLNQMPAIRNQMVAPLPLAACIGAHLAMEALRLLTKLALPQTLGRIMRLDFFAPEVTYHRILRLPRCPACGYAT